MEPVRMLVNKFVEGANTDIAEDVVKNTIFSGAHNMKLTNDDNRQGVIQKQESYIRQFEGYGENLKPLAAKSYDNVIYIVSYNMLPGEREIEYGTFPSADIEASPVPDIDDNTTWIRPKVYKYAPLPNYKTEPKVSANPEYVIDMSYLGGAYAIDLTTNVAQGWELVSSSGGITSALPATGTSGTDITVTVPANNTHEAKQYSISVKVATIGTVVKTIPLTQLPNPGAIGSFSLSNITNITGYSTDLTVSYAPGEDTPGWSITKASGTATAVFSPLSGTISATVSVTISGSIGDTAVYNLLDNDLNILDTINIEIIEAVPQVDLLSAVFNGSDGIEVTSQAVTFAGYTPTTHGVCYVVVPDPEGVIPVPTISDNRRNFLAGLQGSTAPVDMNIHSLSDNFYNLRSFIEYDTTDVVYSSNSIMVYVGDIIPS